MKPEVRCSNLSLNSSEVSRDSGTFSIDVKVKKRFPVKRGVSILWYFSKTPMNSIFLAKLLNTSLNSFQSLHSSCENVPIDLNGLHESVVDSDEDLTDSMDVSLDKKPLGFLETLFINWSPQSPNFFRASLYETLSENLWKKTRWTGLMRTSTSFWALHNH